ncbi:hypothetical protein NDU88_003723 [Pleurodeles waltl]|uniref:Uncharacterized protein n=1 Tax=Pleurodeles waltl TaxID=8319 RepID=A0AAV7NIX9_PLEWA|nr:hypothetical protein NDU88_003723 [Pleurodeles waltl]
MRPGATRPSCLSHLAPLPHEGVIQAAAPHASQGYSAVQAPPQSVGDERTPPGTRANSAQQRDAPLAVGSPSEPPGSIQHAELTIQVAISFGGQTTPKGNLVSN